MVYGTQRNGWLTVTVIDTVRPEYKIRMVKGGPTHPWGGGGGGGSVSGRMSKVNSGREAYIKIISRTCFFLNKSSSN